MNCHLNLSAAAVQAEKDMIAHMLMLMPKISDAAFLHLLTHLDVSVVSGTPSFSLGAVMSQKIRTKLMDPAVKGWVVPDDIDGSNVLRSP